MNFGIFKHLGPALAGVMVLSAAAYASMMGELAKKKQVESGTPRAQKVRAIAFCMAGGKMAIYSGM